jgi:signal transduction histidine kinase
LTWQDRLLGLLKITAKQPRSFGPYELDLVSQFLPHVSIALENSQRAESLESQLIHAIRENALADLALGVAHDVKNALAVALPLVQYWKVEINKYLSDAAAERRFDLCADDLGEIERSIQVSRRIFEAMVELGRRGVRDSGEANLKQAIDYMRSFLKAGLERAGIIVVAELEPDLPPLKVARADVDRLLLNLLTNSRDAMPDGGRLAIRARRTEQGIELVIEDTGCGIPPEHLGKIFEPFYTTKSNGNGLGLPICRTIVWQARGTLNIQSTAGLGTCVTVVLPAAV